MKRRRLHTALFGSAVALGALTASAAPMQSQDALVVRTAGIDRMLPSEKDRALKQALHLLGNRIEELPAEFGQMDFPAGPMRAIYEMLMSPMSLVVSLDPNADPNQGPPFSVQMMVESADEAAASQRAETMFQLIEMAMGGGLVDAPGMPGMKLLDMNGVKGLLGSTNIAGRPSFVAMVNRDVPSPVDLGPMGLPTGVEAVGGLIIDTEPLQPMIEMALEQAGPNAEEIRAQLRAQGVLSDRPLRLTAAHGFGGGYAHGVLNYGNYLANPLNRILIADKRLTEIDLAMIPGDATYAQVSHANLSAIPHLIMEVLRPIAEGQGNNIPPYEEIMAEAQAQLGFNPETDFFAHFGTRAGFYMADSTGGGGLTSAIFFFEVKNTDGMQQTLEHLVGMISEMGEGMARGYVRMERAEVPGLSTAWVLRFPGLPIPFEMTMALERNHLWLGATPQAVSTALGHARNPGNGLLGNARFRELSTGVPRDAVGLTFTDSPKLASRGYGMASMGLSALSNMVRSPSDRGRAATLMMPSLRELLDGAKGSLIVTRVQANDLTLTSKSDPSLTLNLCAAAGAVGSSPVAIGAIALGAGVTMPAIARAREQAKQVKAGTQLRQLHVAVLSYEQANGKLPPDIQTLIREGYIAEEMLISPIGSAGDATPDIWINLADPRLTNMDADRIIGYDRGAYLQTYEVNVLFADGHVERHSTWDFDDMISDEKYEGVDFKLPGMW